MRSCPNCRLMQADGIGQCPECGAPMSRQPNAPQDPNAHLYGMRANAGAPAMVGNNGGLRPGSEPNYKDTAAVKAVALEVIGSFGAS